MPLNETKLQVEMLQMSNGSATPQIVSLHFLRERNECWGVSRIIFKFYCIIFN